MTLFDVGRLCVKTAGREAGKYCVIVKRIDNNFVIITGPKILTKVKRRRCNIEHLEPLEERINIKPDATDDEILKVYEKAGIFKKLNLKKPTTKKISERKTKKKKQTIKRVKKDGN